MKVSDNLKLERTAKKIAVFYKKIDGVKAIALGGSTARHFADEKSDIEMYVYYESTLPKEATIKAVLKKMNAPLTRSKKIFWFHKAWGHHTFFKVDDIKVELGYRKISEIERRIDEFMKELKLPQHGIHDTPFGHYESGLASCLDESLILYDKDGWLRRIKSRVHAYPSLIRTKTLDYYLKDADTLKSVKLKQAILRNDTFNFNACCARIIRSIIIVLFVLNKKYYPGDKWNDRYIQKFKVKPKNFEERIKIFLSTGDVDIKDKKQKFLIINSLINDLKLLSKKYKI